ncbi:hypothetical protein BU16DRAFT_556495 [Lophium mytilinum]|uniref:Uncharacterized protein n=1 Tax=Lophium mytilinum TaxID=390894 RepID=A0A6A6R5E4_9PEZI|nr:hypothetical protein BU16DRAFT_556495 [Lophium mytilinum]
MWKRLQGHVREKPAKQIGNPVLIETTYDEKSLDGFAHVADLNSPTSPQHLQPNYGGGDVATQLPSLPFQNLAPNSSRNNRYSSAPTASSVYSQPSPEMNYDWSENNPPAKYSDVSPPSSPEMGFGLQPHGLPASRDISPVRDDGLDRKTQPRGSHIPVLRKATTGRGKQPMSNIGRGRTASDTTRWDELTGEPTSSYAGKPAQVVPGHFAYDHPSADPPMGYHVSVTGGAGNSRRQNTSRFASNPLSVETKPREEWRGASGRAAIVPPLADKRTKHPLTIPPRDHRKPSPGIADESGRSTPSSAAETVRRIPMGADTSQVSSGGDLRDDPIKPTVPLKVGRNSPPRSAASPTYPIDQHNYPYPSPVSPSNRHQDQGINPYTLTPLAVQAPSAQQPSGLPKSKIHRKSVDSNYSAHFNKDEKIPTSRFSWTTYATNTTYQNSPPPSPPPPMPTSSLATSTPTPAPTASPILNRRRPVVPAASTVSTPTPRKPLPPGTPTHASRVVSMSSAYTVDRSSKALPLPPPSLESQDHISSLEAQQDDLRVRRQNVARLIADLNSTQPQNPLVTDYRKVREADVRKADFMKELDEIKQEEHEVGLKLHRAWKKREREDPGMESAFWIRRVTG